MFNWRLAKIQTNKQTNTKSLSDFMSLMLLLENQFSHFDYIKLFAEQKERSRALFFLYSEKLKNPSNGTRRNEEKEINKRHENDTILFKYLTRARRTRYKVIISDTQPQKLSVFNLTCVCFSLMTLLNFRLKEFWNFRIDEKRKRENDVCFS